MEHNDYNKQEVNQNTIQDTIIEEPWLHQFESDETDSSTRTSRHIKTNGSSLYTKIIFTVFVLIILVVGAWAVLKGFNVIGGTSQQGTATPAVPKLVLQSQTTTTTVKADEQSSSTTKSNTSAQTTTSTARSNATGETTYTVASGDSAYTIAEAFGMTVSDFYTLNGMTEASVLHPNQVVKVKSATNNTNTTNNTNATTTRPETTTNTNTSVGNYTIQSGDSIYSIALKYQMSMSEFKQLNGLTDDSLLLPGQVVKVNSGR